jgi:starch synthase
MKVLFVVSEAVPLAKTGGLADVAGALPQYLNRMGVETSLLMPKYKGIIAPSVRKLKLKMLDVHEVQICQTGNYLFVDYPDFFERAGLYGDRNGDYADNCERFTLFCMAALRVIQEGDYDIVHCHDWQTGLVPLYMKRSRIEAKSIFTIHNLGYQGKFPAGKFPILGLEKSYMTSGGLEFYGDMSFLKAGIVYADKVSTVSRTYAREIQSPELGFGLEGVLRARSGDLHGIINGIDYSQWNPESDDLVYENYSNFIGKQKNKKALCSDNCLAADKPLIGIVSRIAGQKGFDILLCALDEIIKVGFNVIILGLGEEAYQRKLERLSNVYHGRLSLNLKFDNRLAHRIYAGSDFFLMPSLYEPCGLGQLISLRYGTVPIVRKTGGLADTVFEADRTADKGNGFLFTDYSGQALFEATRKALSVYKEPDAFRKLSEHCMSYNYSWNESAKQYRHLYEGLHNP